MAWVESGSPRVALALGSGGARGYAHIGAIEVLRDRGYEIVSVAGSSMGAVVGGMFAAGKIDAFTEWATGLGWGDVLRMFDPSITGPGVIGAEKIVTRLRNLLAGAVIEELPVPFTAVATDLLARKAVWFQEGPVDVAIRGVDRHPRVDHANSLEWPVTRRRRDHRSAPDHGRGVLPSRHDRRRLANG